MRISDWSSDVCSSDLVTDVEVLRSEFDAGGYDLVMARGRVTRHIQFKTKIVGGKTDEVKISLRLMEKPTGCVLWIVVTRSEESRGGKECVSKCTTRWSTDH